MIFIVYDERSSSHDISSVPHFSLSAPDLFGLLTFLNIIICIKSLQQRYCSFGFGQTFDGICTNNWNLRDTVNLVPPCHQQGRDCTGCQRRADGIPSLLLVNGSMPSSPCLGGSKHASTSTHVTKSSLTRAVSTTTSNTRNTGNSTSGTPGFS